MKFQVWEDIRQLKNDLNLSLVMLELSKLALERLLKKLAQTGATLIFTFPEKECSNGLSGSFIVEIAEQWFDVQNNYLQ